MDTQRYFEVRMLNGSIGILSEAEIETFRDRVQEVRTEFTEKEIEKMDIKPLDKESLETLGIWYGDGELADAKGGQND